MEQKRTDESESVVREYIRPDGVVGIRALGDHPEALAGVVDDRDGFAGHGGDGPVGAKEVQGIIGVELALVVEGQVEVQQRDGGDGFVVIAFL